MRKVFAFLVIAALLLTLAGAAVAADYGPSFPFRTNGAPR